MTMKSSPNSIFHFVRGAVRGAYGQEELRGRRILIIGMNLLGQQLLTMFCMDGVKLFFMDDSLSNYDKAHMVCPPVRPYTEQLIEVVINLPEGFITVKDKSFDIDLIGKDPYNQGIHAYYM